MKIENGWHDTPKGMVYTEDGYVVRAMKKGNSGHPDDWVPAAVYEPGNGGLDRVDTVKFEHFVNSAKYVIR